jgi:hypothetical protein
VDSDPVDRGMQIYVQLGFAGVMVFVFLVQFFASMFERRRTQADLAKIIEKSSIALEQTAQSNQQLNGAVDHLRISVDNMTRQSGELQAYLTGKDEGGRREHP